MGKWTNNVVKALENLGGQGTLEDIYKEFEAITKSLNQDFSDFKNYKGTPNWKATVRRELQQNASNEISYNPKLYQDLFFKLRKGVWGLKDNKTMVKIVCYYLSKYLDYNGQKNYSYTTLGFKNRTDAIKSISIEFNEKENNVKNFEDQFDPINDNRRKGWYQKPLSGSFKNVVNLYSKFSKDDLEVLVKKLLNQEKIMVKKVKKAEPGNPYKTASSQQEDALYSFFKKLGFDESFLGKRIHFQSGSHKGEIDVIAKNGNNIFICHCSQNKSMRNLMNRMKNLPYIHGQIVSYLKKPLIKDHKKWTIDKKTNVIMIFDVKGNEVGTGEKIRQKMANDPQTFKNAYLWDTEFRNYYLNELKLDKNIARNWLMYVCGVTDVEEHAEFQAIKVDYGLGNNVADSYLFTADVSSFYRHAYVQQRRPYYQSADYYQRLLKPIRMKQIGKYINRGNVYFPNNIVVNIENPKESFNFLPSKENPNFGTIKFKKRCCAHVIDGQHRLFSYLKSDHVENAKVLVNALTVSSSKEHEFFVKINDEQQGVDQELIWDLKGEMYKDDFEGKISNTWKTINKFDENSYFFEAIKMPSFRAPNRRGQKRRTQYLSLGGLCRVTKDKFAEIYKNPIRFGRSNHFHFNQTDKDGDKEHPKKLAAIISDFFNRLYKELPEEYKKNFLHDGGKQKIKAGIHYVMIDTCRFAINFFEVNRNNFTNTKRVDEFFKILAKSITILGPQDLQGQGQYQDYLKDLVQQIRLNDDFKDFAKPEIDLDIDDSFRYDYIESQFEPKMNTILLNLFTKDFGNDYIEEGKTKSLYSKEAWEKAVFHNGGNEDLKLQSHFAFGSSKAAFFKKGYDKELEDCILETFDGPFVSLREFNNDITELWDYNINMKHKTDEIISESTKLKISVKALRNKKYNNKVLLDYKSKAEKILKVFDNIAESEGFLFEDD